jgi:hypothetical protein
MSTALCKQEKLFPFITEITQVPLKDPSLAWLPVPSTKPLNTTVWFTCYVPPTMVCFGVNIETPDARATVDTINGPLTTPLRPTMMPAASGNDPQFPPHRVGSVSIHHALCGDAPADACSAV